MKLEATVHPISISQNDANFNPDIHIGVEVLSSQLFRKKMIGLPVTAYHHDTMKAIQLLTMRKVPLTASNMAKVLQELHNNLPTPQELARQVLKKEGRTMSAKNIWKTMPLVTEQAGGPGVLGRVTKYWRDGQKWMVAIELNNISNFQKKLIKKGGALGEISLTHAVIDNVIEPLEISFTIQGLRTGSTINRIVSASAKSYKQQKMSDCTVIEEEVLSNEVTTTIDEESQDPAHSFYQNLPNDADRGKFMEIIRGVKSASSAGAEANSKRLRELEDSMNLVQESVVQALNEMNDGCFGKIAQNSPEQWKSNPSSLATANQFILAAAANNYNKRKRDTEELDKALEDISTAPRVVAASSRQKTRDTQAEDEFFKELRNMRAHLKTL